MMHTTHSFTWKEVMRYRNEVFGIAAIWIVLFHLRENIGVPAFPLSTAFSLLLKSGNMGVDIFLLLSAIGLSFSMQKNTLGAFYKNRVLRVFVPYLLLALPFFAWYNFGFLKNGVLGYLANVTTANFWLTGDHPTWYIAFILIAYAVFPLLYVWDNKTKHISTVCLILLSMIMEYGLYVTESALYDNAERALSRIPIFLIGLLFAPRVLREKGIAPWKAITAGLVGAALFLMITVKGLPVVLLRYIYGVIAVCAIILYGFLRSLINIRWMSKVLSWLGGLSLEIYIVHVMMLRAIKSYDIWHIMPTALWYIVFTVVALLCAKGLSLLAEQINRALNRSK